MTVHICISWTLNDIWFNSILTMYLDSEPICYRIGAGQLLRQAVQRLVQRGPARYTAVPSHHQLYRNEGK